MDGKKKIRIKFFRSYFKERIWLEEMALQGWFLKDVNFGLIFTFYHDVPKRMLYELDRFNISKNPTLEEIRGKEMFIEMAEEMGWREVTHDETLAYYFCKEFVPDDINELCNDEESRKYRSEKFIRYFNSKSRWLIVYNSIFTILALLLYDLDRAVWFKWFIIFYNILCTTISLYGWNCGKLIGREMRMSRQEWLNAKDKSMNKKKWKLILTITGLETFLQKEASSGWILTKLTPLTYHFTRYEERAQIYAIDSRWLTNKRLKTRLEKQLLDKKDFYGLNNDWQILSSREAEEKGWSFVCAIESRLIVYKGNPNTVQPLNNERYNKWLRGVSFIGSFAITVIAACLVGGIVGGLMSQFIPH